MCPMLLNRLTDGPSLVLSPSQDHVFFPFPSYPRLDCPPSTSSSVDLRGNNCGSFNNNNNNNNGVPSSSFKKDATFSALASTANPSKKRSCREAGFDGAGVDAVSSGTMAASPRFLNQASASVTHGHMDHLYQGMAGNAADSASNTNPNTNTVRKFQRLDTSAPTPDDAHSHPLTRQSPNGYHSDSEKPSSGSLSSQESLVDDATRLLGISWQRIDNDGDAAAAVRGWKKFIDLQYSAYLQDSQILMKNRAENLYLVAAHPTTPVASAFASVSASSSLSFYLFSDDLSHGQLVGSTWETTVQNIRSVPIAFEGTEVLRAGTVDKSPQQQELVHVNGNMMGQAPLMQSVSCGWNVESNGDLRMGVGLGTGMDIDS